MNREKGLTKRALQTDKNGFAKRFEISLDLRSTHLCYYCSIAITQFYIQSQLLLVFT